MLKLRWRQRARGENEARAAGVEATASGDAAATSARGANETPDEARVRESLEVVKTAVVWLVVINILTVLSPLLWLSLKWTIAVGVLLMASSIVIGCVTYLRARAAQQRLPE
jgi:hypothetical protein